MLYTSPALGSCGQLYLSLNITEGIVFYWLSMINAHY